MDRDSTKVGKKVGGGVCLYVNESWCNSANVCVKKRVCMEDVELISVSQRPCYLPCEFGRIFVTVVYAPFLTRPLLRVLERQSLPLPVNCNFFQLMPHVLLSVILTTVI